MARDRQALLGRLGAAVRQFQRSTDELDELVTKLMGVNRTDARVLDLLEEHERLTAGQIAEGAGLTSGAVTGVIDRLERAGYARRVRDDADRRRVIVEKTPRLTERVEAIYAPFQPKGEKLMRDFSEEELALITRFVRDATEVTDAHADELRARAPSRGSRA